MHIDPTGRPVVRARPRLLPQGEWQAWASLTATTLQPWEARVLLQIDRLWLQAWHAGQPGARATRQPADD